MFSTKRFFPMAVSDDQNFQNKDQDQWVCEVGKDKRNFPLSIPVEYLESLYNFLNAEFFVEKILYDEIDGKEDWVDVQRRKCKSKEEILGLYNSRIDTFSVLLSHSENYDFKVLEKYSFFSHFVHFSNETISFKVSFLKWNLKEIFVELEEALKCSLIEKKRRLSILCLVLIIVSILKKIFRKTKTFF